MIPSQLASLAGIDKVRERPSGTCHKFGLEGADKGSKLVWVWSFVEDRVDISFFEMRNLSKLKLQGAHAVHYKYNKVRERPSRTCHKLGLEGADKGSKLVWSGLLWRTELLFPFLK